MMLAQECQLYQPLPRMSKVPDLLVNYFLIKHKVFFHRAQAASEAVIQRKASPTLKVKKRLEEEH